MLHIYLGCFFFYTSVVNFVFFFFFNDTATTEIYTLSLHDALPIFSPTRGGRLFRAHYTSLGPGVCHSSDQPAILHRWIQRSDRKSTRLNSSHSQISYAVFCLKKKKKK